MQGGPNVPGGAGLSGLSGLSGLAPGRPDDDSTPTTHRPSFRPGRNAVYFALQFFAVSVERFIEDVVLPPGWFVKRVPFAMRLALVVAWLSVTTTLFMAGRLAHSHAHLRAQLTKRRL